MRAVSPVVNGPVVNSAMVTGAVYVVMPGDVDRVAVPSGGNVYDRRVCEGMALTRPVHEIAVAGSWPRPDTAARQRLDDALAAVPDGAAVLLDGLVACGVPEIVVPHARRLRLTVLVHLPLRDETDMEDLADLDAGERETLHAAGAVVATSTWGARRLVDHHGLDTARVHVAAPGVEPVPASEPGDGTRLLCVASVTRRKGHDLLVQALTDVADLPWTCECVGPMRYDLTHVSQVRKLVEQHDLDDRISLAGPRMGERLAATYAGADLLVLPSRAETYGMVVTEALARGIPVLATSVGGVPEALGRSPDGRVPGILVPPDDVAALAAALRRWLTEPALRHDLRDAALERRGTLHDWDATTRDLTAVLDREAR
ncbi:glycosyltransferase family 4 protein [Actinomadura sp. 9N407]|uniref:glycosyltransferase family 4 protein n=1 Tax=Actinomadura sp. 9N407 TaxID=3375154 RepID=UPI0037A6F859